MNYNWELCKASSHSEWARCTHWPQNKEGVPRELSFPQRNKESL